MSDARPTGESTAPDPGEAPRLSSGKKLVFALLSLLVCLAIAEGVHRLIAYRRYHKVLERFEAQAFYEEHPVLPYVLRPGTWTNLTPGWEAARDAYEAAHPEARDFVFHVNRQRLRGPALREPWPEAGVRILCLGASTTFGTGCMADSLTYPGQLQSRLRARFDRPLEVLNAGVPRYRSAESLLNLRRLEALEPDIVLIYHGINDIVWCDDSAHYADPENVPREPTRVERMRMQAEAFLLQELWRRATGFYPEKHERGTGSLNYPEARESFRGNLTRLVERSRVIGALPLLVTFATRLRDELSPAEQQDVVDGPLFRNYFPDYASMDGALKAYNQIVREVAAATGAGLVDLEGQLPADGRYWVDFCHLTGEGTSYMVEGLEEAVAQAVAELP